MIEKKLISVLGGNGFLGRYLVNILLSQGYYVKVISRSATLSKQYFTIFKPGQYKLTNCDITNFKELEVELNGTDYVINLVGLLVNQNDNSFQEVHYLAVKNLIKICRKLEVKKIIHVSAIGADKNSNSSYARTKYYGEQEIKSFSNYCIIRPSIIVGDEDNFVNFFAKMSKNSPFLPLIGGGKTLFQPIWVQDLANIIFYILEKNIKSKTLEVGGDEIFSFKNILEVILSELQLNRKLIPIPFSIAKKMAFFLEKLPNAVLTRDQVEMLRKNNTISKKNDYRKYIEFSPFSFKKIVKKQLNFMKSKGGHLN
ncbi:MAG: hypothetical protein CFH34_00284 [Alphaproteobacteria bacterium MarineAlpha9_Bin4]|nr:complex I NDUFA9 subunit family protein [Pelagibacterales bacterium]PPR27344.1 MAG: hypothetical protein CFH34_00284 [Alphaproteobacteria bacterium MarineAlpha9_Bin4]|tara:strand:+ start:30 stop:965 length:936 start_codon:yes stop_codon:yes gene_type:complete